MKKNLVLITSSFVIAAGLLFNSCESAPSTKADLKSSADTISYSLGASIAENLEMNLNQSGILADTMMVIGEYSSRIAVEQDEVKKSALQKEMKTKIDSVNKANAYAIINFLQGFKDGMNARESQTSYNMGVSYGSQVAQQAIPGVTSQFLDKDSNEELDKNIIVAAASAVLQKKNLVLPHASSYLMMKSQEMQQKEIEGRSKLSETNKIEGEIFLAENKTKEGVVTLASGVQYKILTPGNGPKPKLEDAVVCHYHGTLIDGTVFDSSVERGEPAEFPLQGVIPGWTEVLQLMPVGSKWEVYLPYDSGYGENGAGADIGPFSTLKFQIELLSIAGNK